MADISDRLEQRATEPAASAVDGRSATNDPIPDLIELSDKLKADAAAEGANANGGPKSGWNMLRPARAIPPGGC